jgi:hypothetical protein
MNIDKGLIVKNGEKPRKEYRQPTLTDYGSISDLTRGENFQGNDGNTKCTTDIGNDITVCLS